MVVHFRLHSGLLISKIRTHPVKKSCMTDLRIQTIEKKFSNKRIPVLRPGYQVRVHQKIKEGEKERVQIFEGLVLGTNSGLGASKTFTVRKIVEGIGVEKVFPMYSPNIVKVEIKKTFGVRRAKLFYLRKPEGVSTRLKAKLGLEDRDAVMRKGQEDAEAASMENETTATAEAVGADKGAAETVAPAAAAESTPETK